MGQKNSYGVFVGESEIKKAHGRYRRRGEDNINIGLNIVLSYLYIMYALRYVHINCLRLTNL